MKHQFRTKAREALARAKKELDSQSNDRLLYAALELRMCIEAITYERAQTYKDDLPPAEYNTWQPRRLLQVLIAIEPRAGMSGKLSFCETTPTGEPSGVWHELGEDRVYGLAEIRESYDKLGNFLHQPTLKQVQSGGPDYAKIRERCIAIMAKLEHVLAANLYGINFQNVVTFDCGECNSKVRKRFQPNDLKLEATCFKEGCNAIYTLERDDVKQDFVASRKQHLIECMTPDCTHSFHVPHEKVKEGSGWTCPQCKKKFAFMLGVGRIDQPLTDSLTS